MSDEIAIKVDNVSKTFRLPHEKNDSIKSTVINFYRSNRTYEKQEALRDVSFEVKKGEFFGIVGRNGSGKSTLLKMLAGIYSPSQGTIQVNGKLTPFIELGVGFNPELTGRENVFLNGALLGFNRKEMNKMYKDIVDFAELERFMDQKLKNYSSGMQVRLAFSIAIRAKSDILVLDEVLAVGDERFQDKCLSIFEQLKKQGRTIILVTHDMSSVRRFCDRAAVIHNGNLLYQGSPLDAANEYIKLNLPESAITEKNAREKGSNIEINIAKVNGSKSDEAIFSSGDKVTFNIRWKANKAAKNVGVAIFTESGQYVFGTNTDVDQVKVEGNKLNYELDVNLGDGNYYTQVGVFGETDSEKIYYLEEGLRFRVVNSNKWGGLTKLQHGWRKSSV